MFFDMIFLNKLVIDLNHIRLIDYELSEENDLVFLHYLIVI